MQRNTPSRLTFTARSERSKLTNRIAVISADQSQFITANVAKASVELDRFRETVSAIEGPNEVNFQPAMYAGGTTLADQAALQQALYAAIQVTLTDHPLIVEIPSRP